MDAAQTEKLKALALAAPEGPWTWGTKYVAKPGHRGYSYVAQCPDGEQGSPAWEEKARFIAAANPATVLALIAEVERLRADAERYRWWRVFFDDCDATMPDAVCEAYTAVELDAAIDVAIAASKEKA